MGVMKRLLAFSKDSRWQYFIMLGEKKIDNGKQKNAGAEFGKGDKQQKGCRWVVVTVGGAAISNLLQANFGQPSSSINLLATL